MQHFFVCGLSEETNSIEPGNPTGLWSGKETEKPYKTRVLGQTG